jgi:citrate lyase subunit beta / citryl-CoA lyase
MVLRRGPEHMQRLNVKISRSFLFVPATRIDRLSKAFALEADEIIVDLEDAVGHDEKADARTNLSNYEANRPVYVRINATDTEYFDDDVVFCKSVAWVKGVVLPMASSGSDVERLKSQLGSEENILALIETPRGILAAEEIALSGVSRLMFGTADYCAALATPASDELFAYPRSRLVLASALAGLPAPVDGPALDLKDTHQLAGQARSARALGMGGKLCVHPTQLQLVNEIFGPSADERAWARKILDAAPVGDGGVFAVDGEMVDAPVLARAKWIDAQ